MQQKYWTLPMNIECYKWSKLVYENILKIEPTVLKFEFAQCWEWRIQFTNFQIAMKIERLINYYNVLYNFGCIQIKVGLVVLGTWFWLYSFFFFFLFWFWMWFWWGCVSVCVSLNDHWQFELDWFWLWLCSDYSSA